MRLLKPGEEIHAEGIELFVAMRDIAILYANAGYPLGDSYEGMTNWVAELAKRAEEAP